MSRTPLFVCPKTDRVHKDFLSVVNRMAKMTPAKQHLFGTWMKMAGEGNIKLAEKRHAEPLGV